MATRRESLEVQITARDNASRDIDAVARKATDLDGATSDVTLDATDNASSDIDRVGDRADELDRKSVDIDINADDNGSIGGIAAALGNAPGGLGNIAGALTSPAGAITAVGGGLLAAAGHAVELATEAGTLASLFASTPEEVSGLAAVLRTTADVEAKDLADIIVQMSQALVDSPEHAETLGITLDEVRQNPVQAFIQAVNNIAADGKFSFEEMQAASVAFGEEGVRQVAAVVAAVGPEGLSGAIDDLPDSAIISDEDVENAREFSRRMAELKTTFSGFAQDVGTPVIDFLTDLLGGLDRAQELLSGDLSLDEIWNNSSDAAERFEGAVGNAESTYGSFADLVEDRGDNVANELGVTRSELDQLVAALEDGKSPAEAWNQVIGESSESGRTWAQIAGDVRSELEGQTEATDEAAEATHDYAQATEDATEAHEALIGALETEIDLLDDQIDAYADSADAYYAQLDALADITEAQTGYNAAVEEHGSDSQEARDAVRNYRDAVIDFADATVRAAQEEARANGVTLTRTQVIDAENDAYLAQAATVSGPLQQSILAHVLRINGIPESRITEILTDTDPNDLAQTEAELDGPANKRRVASIQADADQASIDATNARLNAIANQPRTAFVGVRGPGARLNQGPQASAYATGTSSAARGLALVHENELIDFNGGEKVYTAAETRAMLAGRATPNVVNIENNFPAGLSPSAVAAALRRQARIQGS